MTQCERILKYMRDFGSINPMQAMKDLGVMRLAARVADLKNLFSYAIIIIQMYKNSKKNFIIEL